MRPPPGNWGPLALAALSATAGGLVLGGLGIPGGLVLGAVLGAAVPALAAARPIRPPRRLQDVIMIAVGTTIGLRVTPDVVVSLRELLLPAVGSAVLIILAGVAIAMVLRLSGHGPRGELLATSPGALEVLTGLAAVHTGAPVEVALFHIVRILVVVATLPLLI